MLWKVVLRCTVKVPLFYPADPNGGRIQIIKPTGEVREYALLATKSITRPLPPVIGGTVQLDKAPLIIRAVDCEEDRYVVSVELSEDRYLGIFLGESSYELEREAWYETVITAGGMVTMNDWLVTTRRCSGLSAAA